MTTELRTYTGRPFRRVLVVALLAIPMLLAAVLLGRTAETAFFLMDVALRDPPAEPARAEVIYDGPEVRRRAHLYLPDNPRAAIVLVPGATAAALEDPRLIQVAVALKRRSFLVLIPELAGEHPLDLSTDDIGAIADAVKYLAEAGPFPRIGLVAASYALAPAIAAGLEPDTRDLVGLTLGIGGFHDIVAAITYVTTGAFRPTPGAPWEVRATSSAAKWRFLQANAVRVGNEDDSRVLAAIARHRLADPQADTADLAARLGPEGQAVYALLANRDPDRVPGLIEVLPDPVRQEIRGLDLSSRDLTQLQGRLILIHGLEDPLVHHGESRSLALAAGPERTALYFPAGIGHVDISLRTLGDVVILFRAVSDLLTQRDALGARTR